MTRPPVSLIPRFRVFRSRDSFLGATTTSASMLWLGVGISVIVSRGAA